MMRITTALATVVFVVAACAGGGTTASPALSGAPPSIAPGGSPAIVHPTGANDLVLRLGWDGGFVAPGAILTRLPTVSVYGDGRVITEGPQIEIFPGPALPNLVVSRVSEAGLQAILAAARDAGLLGPDASYPYPGVADAPTTTFVVVADGAVHTISAYALGIGLDATGMTPAEAAARAKLTAFESKMTDLAGWLGTDVVSAEAPYTFDAIRVFARPAEPTSPDGQVAPTVADWPLPGPLASAGIPLDGIGGVGLRCVLVAGDDLATLRPALEAANQLTYWRSGGATYGIALRPLLPDEAGCPAT